MFKLIVGNGVSALQDTPGTGGSNNVNLNYNGASAVDNLFSVNDAAHTSRLAIPSIHVGNEGDIPVARAEHSAIVLNNRMYIFGGVTQEYQYMNDLYYFDIKALQWNVVDAIITTNSALSSIPGRRAGHAMLRNVSNPTEFYIFGGRGKAYGLSVISYNDVWRFSTVSNQWSCLTLVDQSRINTPSSPITGRQYSAAAMIDSRIWIYGGIDPVTSLIYNDLWSFHVRTRQWTLHSPNSGSVTGYGPPPLYNAHMIPLTAAYSNDIHYPLSDVNSVNITGTTTRIPNQVGIALYGGMGSGGSCGPIVNNRTGFKTLSSYCTPAGESTIGQIYKVTITLTNRTIGNTRDRLFGQPLNDMNIRDIGIFDQVESDPNNASSTLNENLYNQNVREDDGVAGVSWDYIRIATDSTYSSAYGGNSGSSDGIHADVFTTASTVKTRISQTTTYSSPNTVSLGGKYLKTYALESVVYDDSTGLIYELGGMQMIDPLKRVDYQSATAVSTLVYHSLDMDSGEYLPVVSWDKLSGEGLFNVNHMSTDAAWIYSDGFLSTQPVQNYTTIEFMQSFKIFTVASPEDIILLIENYIG